MEGVENVQTQPVAETSQGVGSAGAEPSSSVSAAEPVAPTSTQEPSAESAQVSEGSSEPVQESLPGVDSFSWDEWDGEDYDVFPEHVKGWAHKLGSRHTEKVNNLDSTYNKELSYWKRMYEALQYGDEDPRIEEMTNEVQQLTEKNTEWEQKITAMQQEIEQEREQENVRYFSWFEKNYQGKLEELANSHGAETAEAMVLDLMDLGMEVHLAVEVSLLGKEATDAAKDLANKIADTNIILEVINNRYGQAKPTIDNTQNVKTETKAPNPATQVVAGNAPVSRPAQLQKEKAPAYGSTNQRMASLMSAAENAIRKSKRR